jgi:hypothetical protein
MDESKIDSFQIRVMNPEFPPKEENPEKMHHGQAV